MSAQKKRPLDGRSAASGSTQAKPSARRTDAVGLEEAAALRLSAALVHKSHVPVARIRAQARRLLGSAVVAYATARSLEAPSLSL